MPFLSTVPRRRRRSEDEDDDEASTNSSRDTTPASRDSINGKRRRLDPVHDGVDEDEDDGEIGDEGSDEGTEQNTPGLTQADSRPTQSSISQTTSLAMVRWMMMATSPALLYALKLPISSPTHLPSSSLGRNSTW